MRTLFAVTAALALSACSQPAAQTPPPAPTPQPQQQTPPPAAALDPIGVYDFSTEAQGTPVRGVITITKNAQGVLTGQITTDVTEPMAVSKVTVDGNKMEVRGTTPDGDLIMNVEFTNEKFTGKWELVGMMNGVLTGAKRKN